MRALETGRYLLRATNTGVTAIIDNEGRVLRQAEQFVPAAISGAVMPYAGMTPYALTGDLPAIGLCIAVLLALYLARYFSPDDRAR
jgi:apolipoprotein N-acyltransferase